MSVQTTTATNIGLNDDQRKKVTDLLNEVLADLSVLYIKTRNYHWNVTGIHFQMLHDFFEEQYDQLEESIDEVAERVQMLGERPISTMAEFLQHATLKEHPGVYPDAQTMISNLLSDHESCIRSLREKADRCEEYRDMGTNDFLVGKMEDHEKIAWMLRAHLG